MSSRTITLVLAAALALGALLAWRLGGGGDGARTGGDPQPQPGAAAPAAGVDPERRIAETQDGGDAEDGHTRPGSALPSGRDPATGTAAPAPAGSPAPATPASGAPGRAKPEPTGIAGTVIGSDGRPVAAAHVTATIRADDGSESTGGRTRRDGTYLIDDIDPGTYAVGVRDDRHGPARRQDVVVRAGEVTRGVDFRLEPGPAIVGRVTDDAGAPIAAASVFARPRAPDDAMDGSYPDTETDAEGRYFLGGVAAGPYEVSARSADHLRGKRVAVTVPSLGEVVADFTLERGLAIEGIVVGPAGEPIPRATVGTSFREVEEHGRSRLISNSPKNVTAGADGRFRLGGLPPGVYDLTARAPMGREGAAHAPGEAKGIAAGSTNVRIGLGLAGAIEGVVRDGATGAPIAQVTVKAIPDTTDREDRAHGQSGDITGTDGAYRLAGLAPGAYTVVAEASGRPPAEVRGVGVDAGATATVEIVLEAGAEVAVRVVALPGRAPVAGARIAVDDRISHTIQVETGRDDSPATDASGRFSLRGLSPGKHRIAARAEGYPPGRVAVDVPAHGRLEVEIVLPVGGAIEGRVLDATGRARAGAKVFAGNMADEGGRAEVGADGRYRIGGLAAGTYFVGVQPTDERQGVDPSALRTVVLREGETAVADFVLGEGPRRVVVAGLFRRRGAPAPGERLEFAPAAGGDFGQPRGAETDGEGRYRVELPPGRYLVLRAPMTFVAEIAVPADVAEARFDIDAPPGAIRGRVVDGATDAPVGGAEVGAVRSGGAGERREAAGGGLFADMVSGSGGQATTGADGAFEILDVRPGTYDLVAKVEKQGSARLPGVSVGEGAAEGVVLRIVRGATLAGRVAGARGAPVAGSNVLAVPGGGPLDPGTLFAGREGRVGADGAFAIEGLTPGTYTLIAFAEGGAPGRTVVDFRGEPGAEPVTVVLPEAGMLAVTVVGAGGAAAPGATLDLRDPEGGFVIASIMQLMGLPAGADGAIHLADVAPGRYRLTARLGEAASAPVVVEVRAGEETAVRLQLEAK